MVLYGLQLAICAFFASVDLDTLDRKDRQLIEDVWYRCNVDPFLLAELRNIEKMLGLFGGSLLNSVCTKESVDNNMSLSLN